MGYNIKIKSGKIDKIKCIDVPEYALLVVLNKYLPLPPGDVLEVFTYVKAGPYEGNESTETCAYISNNGKWGNCDSCKASWTWQYVEGFRYCPSCGRLIIRKEIIE